MLGPIEHEHIAMPRLGSNQIRILRHVPRAVYLAVVRDFLCHFDAGAVIATVATDF